MVTCRSPMSVYYLQLFPWRPWPQYFPYKRQPYNTVTTKADIMIEKAIPNGDFKQGRRSCQHLHRSSRPIDMFMPDNCGTKTNNVVIDRRLKLGELPEVIVVSGLRSCQTERCSDRPLQCSFWQMFTSDIRRLKLSELAELIIILESAIRHIMAMRWLTGAFRYPIFIFNSCLKGLDHNMFCEKQPLQHICHQKRYNDCENGPKLGV